MTEDDKIKEKLTNEDNVTALIANTLNDLL